MRLLPTSTSYNWDAPPSKMVNIPLLCFRPFWVPGFVNL